MLGVTLPVMSLAKKKKTKKKRGIPEAQGGCSQA